jgi:peroxiredoxin
VDLQNLHDTYQDQGLVVLGLNCADKHEIAAALIRKDSVTYPNIVDSSEQARKVIYRGYRMSGVPLNYVIDREGKVVAAWYGYGKRNPRAREVLKKLGFSRSP